MLKNIVKFIVSIKWVVIAFWVLVAGIIYFTAPNLSDVANGDQTSFLPTNASAVKADKLTRQLFNDKGGRSSLVLVISRST